MAHPIDSSKPVTWQCPSDWHPDNDGEWELRQLSRLADAWLKREDRPAVRLSHDDPRALSVSLFQASKKIGEAYVNRESRGSDRPIFSVFSADDQVEYHGSSVGDGISRVLGGSD